MSSTNITPRQQSSRFYNSSTHGDLTAAWPRCRVSFVREFWIAGTGLAARSPSVEFRLAVDGQIITQAPSRVNHSPHPREPRCNSWTLGECFGTSPKAGFLTSGDYLPGLTRKCTGKCASTGLLRAPSSHRRVDDRSAFFSRSKEPMREKRSPDYASAVKIDAMHP